MAHKDQTVRRVKKVVVEKLGIEAVAETAGFKVV
jgi:hypothetical protein